MVVAHERTTVERPEWTGKAIDAIVRAQAYASANKEAVARLISKEGRGYLPMAADVVVKAMTDYGPSYEASGANRHADWSASRIDFQPWPYPSATRLIVEAMAGPWWRRRHLPERARSGFSSLATSSTTASWPHPSSASPMRSPGPAPTAPRRCRHDSGPPEDRFIGHRRPHVIARLAGGPVSLLAC